MDCFLWDRKFFSKCNSTHTRFTSQDPTIYVGQLDYFLANCIPGIRINRAKGWLLPFPLWVRTPSWKWNRPIETRPALANLAHSTGPFITIVQSSSSIKLSRFGGPRRSPLPWETWISSVRRGKVQTQSINPPASHLISILTAAFKLFRSLLCFEWSGDGRAAASGASANICTQPQRAVWKQLSRLGKNPAAPLWHTLPSIKSAEGMAAAAPWCQEHADTGLQTVPLHTWLDLSDGRKWPAWHTSFGGPARSRSNPRCDCTMSLLLAALITLVSYSFDNLRASPTLTGLGNKCLLSICTQYTKTQVHVGNRAASLAHCLSA